MQNSWNVGQFGNWNVGQSGAWVVGQSGVWSVNQAGIWSVNQAGVWTVQPGNTPNTVPWLTSDGGTTCIAIAAGKASDTVIKASGGRLCRILVTSVGANALAVFDNASAGSGMIIGQLQASAILGPVVFQNSAANGITVAGNALNPAVTISFA